MLPKDWRPPGVEWPRLVAFTLLLWIGGVSITCFGDTESVEFSIPPYNAAIVAPVAINGAEHLCVIDSGATHCMFHSSLRGELGKPFGKKMAKSANGEQFEIETFAAPQATINQFDLRLTDIPARNEKDDGNLMFRGWRSIKRSAGTLLASKNREGRVACGDLTSIQEASGRNIEGIIGMPLFRASVIRFDFDGMRVKLMPASTELPQEWGRPTPIVFTDSGLPTIDLELPDGTQQRCIIDTGFEGSIALESTTFSRLSEVRYIESRADQPIALANGIVSQRSGRLSGVKVNGFENRNLPVMSGGKESRIGLTYLRRFRVTMDCNRKLICLEKGIRFDVEDPEPSVGAGLLRKGGKTVFTYVQPNSPGDKAGLQNHDELVAIAGEAVDQRSLGEVRWLFREKADANGQLALNIKRDGVERQVSLTITK
jgi:hypothetical protein